MLNKSESKYFNTAVKFDMALLSLLEKKPFEYITIKEVCEEAEVNRSTFYLHYENMNDLLTETIEYFIREFNQSYDVDVEVFVKELRNCEMSQLNFITEQYLVPFLAYVESHRRIIYAALTQMNLIQLDVYFKRFNDAVFDPVLGRFEYPDEQREYVIKFYLNGIAAVLKEWIGNDCTRSYAEICEIIKICIFGKDYRFLEQINTFQNREKEVSHEF